MISWPGVMVEALRQAGWHVHNPLNMTDALQGLTGIKAEEIYKRGNEGIDKTNLFGEVLVSKRDKAIPLVMETSEELSSKFKPTFTYAGKLAPSIPL